MKKAPLLILFVTVFIDLLGFGMVLPLLPYYAVRFGADAFAALDHRSQNDMGAMLRDLSEADQERVVAAAPEVFNHNMETVPRLYRRVRGPKSDYRWTLELLRRVKELNPSIKTKSGLMLGLGESRDELLECLADLRTAGCDFLTLGQYLQPGTRFLPVVRYVPPAEFDELGRMARQLGFSKVASGPFVRSSYHAREMADETEPSAVDDASIPR